MSSPDLDAAALQNMPLAILINRRCGHIASITNPTDPRMVAGLEHIRTGLHAMGRHRWRIETRPATDAELLGLVAGTRCHRCRLG